MNNVNNFISNCFSFNTYTSYPEEQIGICLFPKTAVSGIFIRCCFCPNSSMSLSILNTVTAMNHEGSVWPRCNGTESK